MNEQKIEKTLIIDLDETLLKSYDNIGFLQTYEIYTNPEIAAKFKNIKTYSMIINKNGQKVKIWGIFRPHLQEFLNFVNEYFDHIIFWSAGTESYVKEIIEQMERIYNVTPGKMVWGREKCAQNTTNFHKPISHIQTDLQKRYYKTFEIDPKHTLVLDDKTYTFAENPDNGVLIPQFFPGEGQKVPSLNSLLDVSDHALLDFMKWLQTPEVLNSSDYRLLPKNNIFKQ